MWSRGPCGPEVCCGPSRSPKGRRGADQAARAAAGGKRERRDRRNEQTRPAPRRCKLPASRFGVRRTSLSRSALSARAQPCSGQDGRGRLRSGRGRPTRLIRAEPQSPDRHRAKVTVSAASTRTGLRRPRPPPRLSPDPCGPAPCLSDAAPRHDASRARPSGTGRRASRTEQEQCQGENVCLLTKIRASRRTRSPRRPCAAPLRQLDAHSVPSPPEGDPKARPRTLPRADKGPQAAWRS